MKKRQYVIVVGEAGNEQGHESRSKHVSDNAAIRAAQTAIQPYQGDGWYVVRDEVGQVVARGGRRTL